MAFRGLFSGWTLALAGLASAASASVALVGMTSPETIVRDSFATALGVSPAPLQQIAKSAPVAGTEDFWLTAGRSEGSVAVTKAISVGDRIALAFGGQNRQLEVAAVSDYAPAITEVDTRSSTGHYVLVTARDTTGGIAQSIRFIMEVEKTPVANAAAKARAL